MHEFSASIRSRIAALPRTPEQSSLVTAAAQLQNAVPAKADPSTVRSEAGALAAALLSAYPVPLAPSPTPDPARGPQLYREHSPPCPRLVGDGPGPNPQPRPPPPPSLSHPERAPTHTPLGSHRVGVQGLEKT